MYNCGGNDVYCDGTYDCDGAVVPPENRTHIFWAQAYITPCGHSVKPTTACAKATTP